MRKLLFALCVMLMLPLGMAGGVRNEASIRVIVNLPTTGGHLAEPVAYYYPVSKVFTMEFAAEDFVQLNVAELEGYTINFDMETLGGDIYWGSFEATDYTSME